MMHDAIGPCLDRMQLEQIASGGRTDEKCSMHLESCRSCRDQVDAIRNENDFLGEIIGANTELLQSREGDQHEVDGYASLGSSGENKGLRLRRGERAPRKPKKQTMDE